MAQHVGTIYVQLGTVVLTLVVNQMYHGDYWCHVTLDHEDGTEVQASYGNRDLDSLLDRCCQLVEVFS